MSTFLLLQGRRVVDPGPAVKVCFVSDPDWMLSWCSLPTAVASNPHSSCSGSLPPRHRFRYFRAWAEYSLAFLQNVLASSFQVKPPVWFSLFLRDPSHCSSHSSLGARGRRHSGPSFSDVIKSHPFAFTYHSVAFGLFPLWAL